MDLLGELAVGRRAVGQAGRLRLLVRSRIAKPAEPEEAWNLHRVLLVCWTQVLAAPRLFGERHENEPATQEERDDECEDGVANDGVPQQRRNGTDVLRIARVPVRP